MNVHVRKRLEENRCRVLERIRQAASSAGRDPAEVRLVGVTKGASPEAAALLCSLGTDELGESRADELERKHAWFAARGLRARWHFLGHLQRNKAARVLALADEIHSVDSLRLLETLARLAPQLGRFPGIYLQVKLSAEPSKGGLAPSEVAPLCDRASGGPLPLLGLMTMAPLLTDETAARGETAALAAARAVFADLEALARALPGRVWASGRASLSMGMSGDFEEAVRAGAHVVRVGSALFEGVETAEARRERHG